MDFYAWKLRPTFKKIYWKIVIHWYSMYMYGISDDHEIGMNKALPIINNN